MEVRALKVLEGRVDSEPSAEPVLRVKGEQEKYPQASWDTDEGRDSICGFLCSLHPVTEGTLRTCQTKAGSWGLGQASGQMGPPSGSRERKHPGAWQLLLAW